MKKAHKPVQSGGSPAPATKPKASMTQAKGDVKAGPASKTRTSTSNVESVAATTLSTKKARQAQPRTRARANPLVRALRAPLRFVGDLLSRELRLERDGKNVNIKFELKASAAPMAIKPQAPPSPAEIELNQMRAELKKLLDVHPGTRRVMRHLVYFERALAAEGLQALIEIPEEVLGTALEQLEALVSNWSNRDLATLRSKMSVAAVNRLKDPFYGSNGVKPSMFNTESRLQVGDATHSMFLELERQYQGLVPPEVLQAVTGELAPPAAPVQPKPGEDKSLALSLQ